MRTLLLCLFTVTLMACGAKPSSDSNDTGDAPVDADGDQFAADVDCDDSDATINPDADEICDGIDNNCNDEIDEDAVDFITFYSDSDSDGYGDASAPIEACEAPSGAVDNADDCDDSDADINPLADEICDGIDNDCDASTSEDGTVSWIDGSGSISDVTGELTGTATAPAVYSLNDGSLNFCDGTHYVNLNVEGSAALGSQNQNATATVLDGGGAGTVLTIVGDGSAAAVSDLTIQNGYAQVDTAFGYVGGGIFCSTFDPNAGTIGQATLGLENVILTGNHSPELAGGLWSIGCGVTVSNSEISYNTSASIAGLYVLEGTHSFTGVEITGNVASEAGGGGVVVGQVFSASAGGAAFDDVIVSNNSSADDFPGFALVFGDYTWTGTAGSLGSGVWGNHSPAQETGGLILDGATLVADTVDFGTRADATDNSPYDIYNWGLDGDLAYWAGDDASFTCDDMACGSAATTEFGSTDDGGQTNVLFGVVISPTGNATLDSFAPYVSVASGSCATDFYLLSHSAAATGDWNVEWASTGNASNTTPDWANSGVIGRPLDNSLVYAIAHTTGSCEQTYSFGNPTGAVDVQGLGTLGGFVFNVGESNTFSVGDTIELTYDEGAYFYTQVNVTAL